MFIDSGEGNENNNAIIKLAAVGKFGMYRKCVVIQ